LSKQEKSITFLYKFWIVSAASFLAVLAMKQRRKIIIARHCEPSGEAIQ
jgi:hypothetical protein